MLGSTKLEQIHFFSGHLRIILISVCCNVSTDWVKLLRALTTKKEETDKTTLLSRLRNVTLTDVSWQLAQSCLCFSNDWSVKPFWFWEVASITIPFQTSQHLTTDFDSPFTNYKCFSTSMQMSAIVYICTITKWIHQN